MYFTVGSAFGIEKVFGLRISAIDPNVFPAS